MQLDKLTDRFGPVTVEICRTLERAGYSAEIVGGCVRDALSAAGAEHVEANDIDLTTRARHEEIRAVFRQKGWRTFAQGKGAVPDTIGVIGPDGETYEVTTYWRDVETDGRHATVAFADRLETDLERRDFTVNAIAVRVHPDEDTGLEVDPFGAAKDLERGLLRAVGHPGKRFEEDRLRVAARLPLRRTLRTHHRARNS